MTRQVFCHAYANSFALVSYLLAGPKRAEPDADGENDPPAYDHLHNGSKQRCLHESKANQCDTKQLDGDYDVSNTKRRWQIVHQKRERVEHPPEASPKSNYNSAHNWLPAPSYFSIIRKRFS